MMFSYTFSYEFHMTFTCSLSLEYISVWTSPPYSSTHAWFIHQTLSNEHVSNLLRVQWLHVAGGYRTGQHSCGGRDHWWLEATGTVKELTHGSNFWGAENILFTELLQNCSGVGERGLLDIDMNHVIVQRCLRKKNAKTGGNKSAHELSQASLVCSIKHKSSNRGFSNETGARMNCMGERNGQWKGKKKKKSKKGKE